MAIRPEEITSILEKELESYTREVEEVGVGTVLQVGDGIARIYGLKEAMVSELLEFLDKKGNAITDHNGAVIKAIALNGTRTGRPSCKSSRNHAPSPNQPEC